MRTILIAALIGMCAATAPMDETPPPADSARIAASDVVDYGKAAHDYHRQD